MFRIDYMWNDYSCSLWKSSVELSFQMDFFSVVNWEMKKKTNEKYWENKKEARQRVTIEKLYKSIWNKENFDFFSDMKNRNNKKKHEIKGICSLFVCCECTGNRFSNFIGFFFCYLQRPLWINDFINEKCFNEKWKMFQWKMIQWNACEVLIYLIYIGFKVQQKHFKKTHTHQFQCNF